MYRFKYEFEGVYLIGSGTVSGGEVHSFHNS